MRLIGVWNIYHERRVIDVCVDAVKGYVDELWFIEGRYRFYPPTEEDHTLDYILEADFDVPTTVISKPEWNGETEKYDVLLSMLKSEDWMMYISADIAQFQVNRRELREILENTQSPGLLCYTENRGWGHRLIRKHPIEMTADHHHTYLAHPRLYLESTYSFDRLPEIQWKEARPSKPERSRYAVTVNDEESYRRAWLIKNTFGFSYDADQAGVHDFHFYLNRWMNGEGRHLRNGFKLRKEYILRRD